MVFISKSEVDYIVDARTDCWLWQKAISDTGYGNLRVGGVKTLAHRHYYRVYKGEIPAGLQVDHLCKVRHCVNPNHMELVTNAENTHRGARAKLSMEKARYIREDCHSSTLELASRFNVSPTLIRQVKRNEIWKEIE